jgi:hypothetical protein
MAFNDDATEAWNLRLLAHHDLDGHGDCMHVNVANGFAYVGHMGGDRVGTSVVDVSDPHTPRLVTQILTPPGTHAHKVQVVGDVLLVNHERNPDEPDAREWSAGMKIYDIARPSQPREIGFFPAPGKGVHRMTYWEPPYAYVTGSDTGYSDQFLMIVDLTDPGAPKEVGRWWAPGMHTAGGETPTWPAGRRCAHHHTLVRGDRAYAGWWDSGLYILDIADPRRPRAISHLEFGADVSGSTHTVQPLPGRDVLIVTDEAVTDRRDAVQKQIRAVDISDETRPEVISVFPAPEGEFAARGGRFGPHNLHEMRPGSFQSSTTVHATYFNAGLRVYDVADASRPKEIAYFVPPAAPGAAAIQLNDLTVDADGLIYVTDRAGGGLYIVEPEIAFS